MGGRSSARVLRVLGSARSFCYDEELLISIFAPCAASLDCPSTQKYETYNQQDSEHRETLKRENQI